MSLRYNRHEKPASGIGLIVELLICLPVGRIELLIELLLLVLQSLTPPRSQSSLPFLLVARPLGFSRLVLGALRLALRLLGRHVAGGPHDDPVDRPPSVQQAELIHPLLDFPLSALAFPRIHNPLHRLDQSEIGHKHLRLAARLAARTESMREWDRIASPDPQDPNQPIEEITRRMREWIGENGLALGTEWFYIETLQMLEGDLPVRCQRLVNEWATAYQKELRDMWKNQEFRRLPRLE